MGQNMEIKACCRDVPLFRKKLESLPVRFEGDDVQTDTFFCVSNGWLKFRESKLYGNTLIPYQRPRQSEPKQSDYSLIPITNGEKTKHLLSQLLGVNGIVKKTRAIYWYENVRIHLDTVENLGEFIEFEAVLPDAAEHEVNYKKLNWLMDYFGIQKTDLISEPYLELLPNNLK